MHVFYGQFELEQPSRLAFLAVIVLLGLLLFRSGWEASALKRWLLFAVRSAICVLLVVALASPVTKSTGSGHRMLGLFDVSASMPSKPSEAVEELQRKLSSAGAAGQAEFAATLAVEGREVDRSRSDPGSAVLRFVGGHEKAALPHPVVVTDGIETRGNLVAAAAGAGAPLVFLPPQAASPEVLVRDLRFLGPARPHETVAVAVDVAAAGDGDGEVSLFDGEKKIASRNVRVVAGEQTFVFQAPALARSTVAFRAVLSGFPDTSPANNAVRRTWLAAPRASAALISSRPDELQPHQQALEQIGFRVVLPTPNQLPDAATLANWDLVVLADVAESELPARAGATIRQFVQGGGGLLVVGGERVFGQSAFSGTQLEQMLPVSTATTVSEPKKASLTMVLIIDKSESMLIEDKPDSMQGTRLKLAKEAAKSTVQLLDADDRIGVLAFGTTTEWVSEIAPGGDKKKLLASIESLQSKGETNMFPALEKSYLALEQIESDYKHVILITDGISSPGDFGEAARRMAMAGITVATVSVSSGAEQTVLQDVAQIAGGRHYHCEDPKDLPTILQRETQTAVAAAGPTKVEAFELRSLPGLDVSAAPSLTSYAATTPKPDAELSLLAGEGDPLLAWGELGRGSTAVLTVDRRSLDQAWRRWPNYVAFWRHLASRLARDVRRTRLQLTVEAVDDDRLRVQVDANTEDGRRLNGGEVRFHVTADGQPQGAEKTLNQTAPGRYEAIVAHAGDKEVEIEAMLADQSQTTRIRFSRDYGEEWRRLGVDMALLRASASASGGRLVSSADEALKLDQRTRPVRTPHWPPLLIGAACLWVVDAALRRLLS